MLAPFIRNKFIPIRSNLNAPNLLSLSRILSSPIICHYILKSRYDIPLYLLILHSGSDFLDGWYARKFGAQTKIGKLLDPLADKALFFSTFLPLIIKGSIPLYFGTICLLRDSFILIGSIHSFIRKNLRFDEVNPTYLSKLNTSIQVAYLLSVILSLNLPIRCETLQEILKILITSTVFSSTIQYWKIFRRLNKYL
jgi:cardiolipin synthase